MMKITIWLRKIMKFIYVEMLTFSGQRFVLNSIYNFSQLKIIITLS